MIMRLTLAEMRRIIREEILGQGESHLTPPVQVLRDKLRQVHDDLPDVTDRTWVVLVGNSCLKQDPDLRSVSLEVWREHLPDGSWMLEEFPPRDVINGFIAVLQCCRNLAFKSEEYQAACVKVVNTATNVLRGRQDKMELQSALYAIEESPDVTSRAVHDVCKIIETGGYGYSDGRKLYQQLMRIIHKAMTPQETAKIIGRFYRCPDEKSTQKIW